MQKNIRYMIIILLLTFVISIFVVAENESNKALIAINKLKEIIIFTNDEKFLYAKYIIIDNSSIELLNEEDEDYISIKNHESGQYIISNKLYTTYVFRLKAINVWENNAKITLYVGAYKPDYSNEYNFDIFDGNNLYSIWPVNPKLSQNPDIYYMTYVDNSKCPLKILAYRIHIDKYNIIRISIVVKNLIKKPIVAFSGTFELYDKMGHPVIWGGGSNKFNFIDQKTTIPALSCPIEIGYWELYLYENTRKVKPYIREILYEDGTIWRLK